MSKPYASPGGRPPASFSFEETLAQNVFAARGVSRAPHWEEDFDPEDPEARVFLQRERRGRAEFLLRDAARIIQNQLQRLFFSKRIEVDVTQDEEEPEGFYCEAVATRRGEPVAKRDGERSDGRYSGPPSRVTLFEVWLRHGEESGTGHLSIILHPATHSDIEPPDMCWEFSTHQELHLRLLEMTASYEFKLRVREFIDAVEEML